MQQFPFPTIWFKHNLFVTIVYRFDLWFVYYRKTKKISQKHIFLFTYKQLNIKKTIQLTHTKSGVM